MEEKYSFEGCIEPKETGQSNIVPSPTRILQFEVVMKRYEQIHTRAMLGL